MNNDGVILQIDVFNAMSSKYEKLFGVTFNYKLTFDNIYIYIYIYIYQSDVQMLAKRLMHLLGFHHTSAFQKELLE